MTMIMLLIWSAVVIMLVMGVSKYRYTRPPLVWMLGFFCAGVVSVAAAGMYNGWLMMNTRFTFFSPDIVDSSIAFVLGPGMGEEFSKFGMGLVIMLFAVAVRAPLTPASRIQGFVLVALGFAVVENITYQDVGLGNLLVRGFLPVPMHAAMGFIHGTAVNAALKRGSGIYLFVGYVACVIIHAGYDIVAVNLPVVFAAAIVLVLVAWCTATWLRAPEENPLEETDEYHDPWIDEAPTEDY